MTIGHLIYVCSYLICVNYTKLNNNKIKKSIEYITVYDNTYLNECLKMTEIDVHISTLYSKSFSYFAPIKALEY